MMRRGIYVKYKWKLKVYIIIQSSILRCFVYDSVGSGVCKHARVHPCLPMCVSEDIV